MHWTLSQFRNLDEDEDHDDEEEEEEEEERGSFNVTCG